MPQVSLLGPLLFNIDLYDLFYFAESTNLCNFTEDRTINRCYKDLNSLISRLQHDSYLKIEWFKINSMKVNEGKCHLLISRLKCEKIWW